MIFVDTDFYQNEFLKGRSEIIPFSEFLYWAEEASIRINWRGIELTEDQITRQLKRCTCAVAEALFIENEKQFASMNPSQSVGGYSKGATPNVKNLSHEFNATVDGIIAGHLSGTELHNAFIWRGV